LGLGLEEGQKAVGVLVVLLLWRIARVVDGQSTSLHLHLYKNDRTVCAFCDKYPNPGTREIVSYTRGTAPQILIRLEIFMSPSGMCVCTLMKNRQTAVTTYNKKNKNVNQQN